MGSDTGVYAGIWQSDYSTVLLQRGVEGRSAIGVGVTGCNMLVGRVSFLLGLHGPCVAMDTACSSSLSAFQVGADALRRQDCDNALVMGINIMCDRLTSQIWISAHMTSPTGKSYSFDRRADGYARGEACSSLAIRREEGACSDGFLSEAGAVRQDGKSASLTAPNGTAQQALLRSVLERAGRAASGAFLLQAHATGTSLGDPIEMRSACAVRHEPQMMEVTCFKAVVGHTEPGSGLTGMLLLSTALCAKAISPNAQLRAVNAHVASAMASHTPALPLQVGRSRQVLGPSVGGVSSFGLNGTIAHAVLRDCPSVSTMDASVVPLKYRRRAFLWFVPAAIESVTPRVAAFLPSQAPQTVNVEADSPIMEAGVTSQQTARLVARLRELGGMALSPTLMFEHPTPRSIAIHIATLVTDSTEGLSVDGVTALINDLVVGTQSGEEPPRPMIETSFGIGIEDAVPASTFQEHFLLLQLLQPTVASYMMPMVLQLSGSCSRPIVQAALQLLVRRHSVLRTLYAVVQSRMLQVVLPADGFLVPLDECSSSEWSICVTQTLETPFALTKEPPIRALYMRAANGTARLLVVVHHVATDYSSNLLIHKELSVALDALQRKETPLLPFLPVQYADFSMWQQQHTLAEADMLKWWREKLDGAPDLLQLPLSHPRPDVQAGAAGAVSVNIDSSLGAALRTTCHSEHVNTLSGILVAWAALMLHLSGQKEIVLGQPQSVQAHHEQTKPVVGCYVSTLPLRLSMQLATCSFRQSLPMVTALPHPIRILAPSTPPPQRGWGS